MFWNKKEVQIERQVAGEETVELAELLKAEKLMFAVVREKTWTKKTVEALTQAARLILDAMRHNTALAKRTVMVRNSIAAHRKAKEYLSAELQVFNTTSKITPELKATVAILESIINQSKTELDNGGNKLNPFGGYNSLPNLVAELVAATERVNRLIGAIRGLISFERKLEVALAKS